MRISETIQQILKRCEDDARRLHVPGEGGERSFRAWLASDLLAGILGWPTDRVLVGERFDLTLLDQDRQPVMTIETKAPHREASKAERATFRKRLASYGTLRAAFFTNGSTWERLDLSFPRGKLEILRETILKLDRTSPEEIDSFFAPLGPSAAETGAAAGKNLVTKADRAGLERFASDLRNQIDRLAKGFLALYDSYFHGKVGAPVRTVLSNLFELWCEKSYVVAPVHTAAALVAASADAKLKDLVGILKDLGFPEDTATAAAESALAIPRRSWSPKSLEPAVTQLYARHAQALAVQTAHVFLGRLLLYRIAEDKEAGLPIRLSGPALEELLATPARPISGAPPAALTRIAQVRLEMERFLPTVYRMGEFDWWYLPEDKRAALNASAEAEVARLEDDLESVARGTLRCLQRYQFDEIDLDVWRNVYQHYLPADERQRLGGFYTPDELVELLLDLAEYSPNRAGLCELTFIDPACGSGAFVVGALSRLLSHLSGQLPCHADLHRRGTPSWKRAEATVEIAGAALHGIDIHPFAAFLTTLNVIFALLTPYVEARRRNARFQIDLKVFSADSLEKPDEEAIAPDLFAKLNSRIQLAEDSFQRYQELMKRRFHLVVGNPPWGGVLKGSLAPVFDEAKKERFRDEYPSAANGKYDIYGLFIERGLQLLRDGGRLALVTQGTFIDKEWAADLRRLLATEASGHYLIDLNPFGQLFFGAMNTPAILVWDKRSPGDSDFLTVLLSSQSTELKQIDKQHRRRFVVELVRECVTQVIRGEARVQKDFALAQRIPVSMLAQNPPRWHLVEPQRTHRFSAWCSVADLLEARQGVTPGASLEVFLVTEEFAKKLRLEKAVIHRAIKSKEIQKWRVGWQGRILLYPYVVREGHAIPAFRIPRPDLKDSLDFDVVLDDREKSMRRGKALNAELVTRLLEHRVALGLVRYPNAARYLCQHFEQLEGRVFEKKPFRVMNKQWYEYHRPRDPDLMLSANRIVCPTLVRPDELRFALDDTGYLSDHACEILQFTKDTSEKVVEFRKALRKVVGGRFTENDILMYLLAFLNSPIAQELLVAGRRPTPRGYYQISEEYLREIPVALPRSPAEGRTIILTVKQLVRTSEERKTKTIEDRLGGIVSGLVGAT